MTEYLADLDATAAARRAGYAGKSAAAAARRNLKNPEIAKRIAARGAHAALAPDVGSADVRAHLGAIMTADIADIVDADGVLRPVADWPQVWRRMLIALEAKETFAGSGHNRKPVGAIVKARFLDRLRALELLGKHADVRAFESPDNRDKIDLARLIAEGRKRLKD